VIDNPDQSQARLRPAYQNAVGYALAAVFLFVLCAGIWEHRRIREERGRLEKVAADWAMARVESAQLAPALMEIYAVGMQPQSVAGEEPRVDRLRQARDEFERRFKMVAEKIRALAVRTDREEILRKLDAVQVPAQLLIGRIEALTTAPRPEEERGAQRALETHFREALATVRNLRNHEDRIVEKLGQEHDGLEARQSRIEYAFGGCLFLVVAIGALHFRQRARRAIGEAAEKERLLIERKAGEEALRKSEMRKAAILRSALDCIITFDPDGQITEFNPAAELAFGYTLDAALGRDVAGLIIPETVDGTQRHGLALYDATKDGPAHGRRMEMAAMRADGSKFPVEVAISRIVIDGKPMFTAYVRDISERREGERANAELAAVVANTNDAMVACTLDGTIVSWNRGAESTYGYTVAEAVGRPLEMLIPQERLDEFPQMMTTVGRGESRANYETVRLRKDGKKISVSLTDSPIRGEGGRVTGLSSIARDITERKRLEEELLQSQKMEAVGRLAGGIAHDFNNILTAILGYSDLLIGQIDDTQPMYKHLSEIRKAADFAASLTHQLLAFSRRQPLFLRVFNINDTVRKMNKMLERVLGEQIQIRTVFDAEIGRIKVDPGQLEQVLLNLCVNARDAMPKGGAITIRTQDVAYFLDDVEPVNEMPAGEYVKLTVSDTGTGMTPEVKKHIFEPFFTTKEQGHGTGLGLATCYGIVKQSGGYIAVDSAVGEGTTFSIYLPRVEESGEKVGGKKEVGQLPGGNETVLYVEDEITVRHLTSHVLRRLGYTVLEAGDGKGAKDVVEGNGGRDVHLFFSDVVLPDASGQELARWIRERFRDVKMLFTSGYVDENLLRRHGLDASTAFLQKPFTPADLAKKVREVIDGAS
jgi:PAS domain S-box-containing protein